MPGAPQHALRSRLWLVLLLGWWTAAAAETLVDVNALFEGRAVLTIDGRQHVLRSGQSSPEGVRLVTATAREALIEVDGKRRTLGLSRQVGAAYAEPERRRVAVQRGAAGEYRVAGSINGRQVMFMVDTGANIVALSSAEAKRLGIDYRRYGELVQVKTAGGVVPAWSINLARVELQGIVVHNVRGTVIEGPHPSPALLGMSWLQQVGMREDAGVLYLEER